MYCESDIITVQKYIRGYIARRKYRNLIIETINKIDNNLSDNTLIFLLGALINTYDITLNPQLNKLIKILINRPKIKISPYYIINLNNILTRNKNISVFPVYLNFLIWAMNLLSSQTIVFDENLQSTFNNLCNENFIPNIVKKRNLSLLLEHALIFVLLKIIEYTNMLTPISFTVPCLINHLICHKYFQSNMDLYVAIFIENVLLLPHSLVESVTVNENLIVLSNLVCLTNFIVTQKLSDYKRRFRICLESISAINNLIDMELNVSRNSNQQQSKLQLHPVFGWTPILFNNDSINLILKDISLLWSHQIIETLIDETLFNMNNNIKNTENIVINEKLVANSFTSNKPPNILISEIFCKCMKNFTSYKLEILTNLSISHKLIRRLWNELLDDFTCQNPNTQITFFHNLIVKYVNSALLRKPCRHENEYETQLYPLLLACEITSHTLLIFNNNELFKSNLIFQIYNKDTPTAKQHVVTIGWKEIGHFLNLLVFEIFRTIKYSVTSNDVILDDNECGQFNNYFKKHSLPFKYITGKMASINRLGTEYCLTQDEYTAKFDNLPTNRKILFKPQNGKKKWSFLEILLGSTIFKSIHNLLNTLHDRDVRCNFTESNKAFWVIPKIKVKDFAMVNIEMESSAIASDLKCETEANSIFDLMHWPYRLYLQYTPFILSTTDRINLFYLYFPIPSMAITTYYTIRRKYILEDGMAAFAKLDRKTLRGNLRIEFVNAQGLSELGIDEDGIFLEFLVDSINKLFSKELKLFRYSSEDGTYYPDPSSQTKPNYESWFRYTGILVAKAVCLGLVISPKLAPFFLNHIIQRGKQNLNFQSFKITNGSQKRSAFDIPIKQTRRSEMKLSYNYIDDLQTMDPVLYNSLNYLKNCTDEQIRECALTFSVMSNVEGDTHTVMKELIPGGESLYVTAQNKYIYIHLMALYKLYGCIKNQIVAFTQGFYHVLFYDVNYFSVPELQHLISGDNDIIDLSDLRSNTVYLGGYYDKHKTIIWLWEILQNDFSSEQTRKFLRFVTSCERAPINGFKWLQPPFTIRCVDLNDDDDANASIVTEMGVIGNAISGIFGTVSRLRTPRNASAIGGSRNENSLSSIETTSNGQNDDDSSPTNSSKPNNNNNQLKKMFKSTIKFGEKKKKSVNKMRLPTASTCFNLLKLPNYPSKSILREKLLYALNSGTGFELS